MPSLSVLIPAFNAGKYVQYCLASVLCQTHQDFEIIVINDGSVDSTAEIVELFAKTDSRIKVIHQDNSGLGHALNVGLDNAAGEYVSFLPADWRAMPESYQILFKLADAYGLDAVQANHISIRELTGEHIVTQTSPDWQTGKILYPRTINGIIFKPQNFWGALYRRNLIQENAIRFNETPGSSLQELSFTCKIWCMARCAWKDPAPLFCGMMNNEDQSFSLGRKARYMPEEFDLALAFALEHDPQLAHAIQKDRYMTYCDTYDRVDSETRNFLSESMVNDFYKDVREGLYDPSRYGKKERCKFNLAMRFPLLFRIHRGLKKRNGS